MQKKSLVDNKEEVVFIASEVAHVECDHLQRDVHVYLYYRGGER